MFKLHIFVILVTISKLIYCVEYTININNKINDLNHFWRSTGQCPPDVKNKENFLLSEDNKINIALISALPSKSIQYIRVHWLLDLIHIENSHNGSFTYDFTNLDIFLNWIHKCGLYIVFEFMGNDSNLLYDFDDKNQIILYRKLLRKIAKRYVKFFGNDYVSNWKFETWNEPDLKTYNVLNFTTTAFINYIKATKDGLSYIKKNGMQLRLGGPAGLFKSPDLHRLCWGALEYCSKFNCPFDYISYHAKGNASSDDIVNKGLRLIEYVQNEFPTIADMPFSNDEADPLSGWSTSEDWRGDTRYAAMMVKNIIQHQNIFINQMNIKFELLSNDNAFLNYHPYYFSQRTLLTRFQMNNTNPRHIQFIKKPVYIAMGLLSFLGNIEIKVQSLYEDDGNSLIDTLAAITTTNEHFSLGIITVYSNGTEIESHAKNIKFIIKNLPSGYNNIKSIIYSVDNIHTNVYETWKKYGSPKFPNTTVLQQLRKIEGPYTLKNLSDVKTNKNHEYTLSFTMTLPSVTLIHICGGVTPIPGRVTQLEIFNVTYNQVLLIWNDKNVLSKCIKTYEIEFSFDGIHNFTRINRNDVVFLSFQYAPQEEEVRDLNTGVGEIEQEEEYKKEQTIGWYRIRAIDYWGRTGHYSKVVKYFENERHIYTHL